MQNCYDVMALRDRVTSTKITVRVCVHCSEQIPCYHYVVGICHKKLKSLLFLTLKNVEEWCYNYIRSISID